jgi:hypothetical protein
LQHDVKLDVLAGNALLTVAVKVEAALTSLKEAIERLGK